MPANQLLDDLEVLRERTFGWVEAYNRLYAHLYVDIQRRKFESFFDNTGASEEAKEK